MLLDVEIAAGRRYHDLAILVPEPPTVNDSDHQRDLRIVPHDMRDAFRSEQINKIRLAIQDTYQAVIRAAAPGAARRALKAKRDAEIAAATEQLLSERQSDTTDCL